jgi:hypothetical protein
MKKQEILNPIFFLSGSIAIFIGLVLKKFNYNSPISIPASRSGFRYLTLRLSVRVANCKRGGIP